jgi:hypothetical protein
MKVCSKERNKKVIEIITINLTGTMGILVQMHPQNTENILAGPDIKPRTVGKSQAKGN